MPIKNKLFIFFMQRFIMPKFIFQLFFKNKIRCCICKYPRSGIANKLLVLLRAYNVSKILSIPIYETNFSQIPLISSFRNNVGKRIYLNNELGKSRNNITLKQRINCLFGNYFEVISLKKLKTNKDLFLVKDFPSYPNKYPFSDFELFYEESKVYLRKRIKYPLLKSNILEVAIHVRRGDFKEESDQDCFSSNTRTKISYFLNIIDELNKYFNKNDIKAKFTIYTDQLNLVKNEITQPLQNLYVVCNDPFDDFFKICNSDIIVMSPWSTFSGLAAILGNPNTVIYPEELHYQFTSLPIQFNLIDPNFIASDLKIK